MNKKILIIAIITLVIDQLTKIIIETFLGLNQSFTIIKNFFTFYYTNNYGAAWSLFNNQIPLLVIVSIIVLIIIIRYMNTFTTNLRNTIAFGIVLGGIAGNLIDRLFLGYVRDFIAFKFWDYQFPIFNISDMAIFLGISLLIIAIIKGEDYETNHRKKSIKNR